MTLTNAGDGTTTIRGPVVDQAALHALLHKLGDIGIPLISLTQIRSDQLTHRHRPPMAPNHEGGRHDR